MSVEVCKDPLGKAFLESEWVRYDHLYPDGTFLVDIQKHFEQYQAHIETPPLIVRKVKPRTFQEVNAMWKKYPHPYCKTCSAAVASTDFANLKPFGGLGCDPKTHQLTTGACRIRYLRLVTPQP